MTTKFEIGQRVSATLNGGEQITGEIVDVERQDDGQIIYFIDTADGERWAYERQVRA